jgi:cell division protein FtsL
MAAAAPARAPRQEPARRAPASRPQPKAQPRARRQPVRQPRIASGVVWIVTVGALLAGIVAMNVAVLRLNLSLDGLEHQRSQLRADNAGLESQLSSALSSARIESLARTRLGFVPAGADKTTYVEMQP